MCALPVSNTYRVRPPKTTSLYEGSLFVEFINNKTEGMDTLSFKTVSANKATVTKEWVVVDAAGESLGRVCSKIAKLLRNVIVINADKVVLTGKKWDDRVYLKFSGYPGGQRSFSPRFLQAKGSDRLFRKVVKGMLPKNRLGAAILDNLYVYDGAEHKHEAQQPRLVDLTKLK